MKRKFWLILILITVAIPLFYYLINFSAINMGVVYLLSGRPESESSDLGEFKTINDMVKLTNFERSEYIKKYLKQSNIKYSEVTVTNEGGNIYVSSPSKAQKKALFVAHYDTYLNTAGALDNTSSIAVLLESMKDLKSDINSGKVAFLFSAGEERGLLGSGRFAEYMNKNNLSFDLIVNLDSVGSGNPVVVSSSDEVGLVINFFPFGKYLFNGENFSKLGNYWGLDRNKFDNKKFGLKYLPSIVGFSDTYTFLRSGMNAIHISTDNMKSIVDCSHRSSDTSALLDREYLKKTVSAVVSIGKRY